MASAARSCVRRRALRSSADSLGMCIDGPPRGIPRRPRPRPSRLARLAPLPAYDRGGIAAFHTQVVTWDARRAPPLRWTRAGPGQDHRAERSPPDRTTPVTRPWRDRPAASARQPARLADGDGLAKAGVSAVPAKFDLLRKRVLLAA